MYVKMNNQEISAEAYKKGWEACRRFMCKLYNINESDAIENEERDWDF